MVCSSVRNLSRRAGLFVFRKREAISKTFWKMKKGNCDKCQKLDDPVKAVVSQSSLLLF
jgi:hypothetical protein